MPSDPHAVVYLALLTLLAIVTLIVVILIWQSERRRANDRIEALLEGRQKDLLSARRESVEKARSSLKGQIAEQMAPLLPGFQYLPADARFLGDPIDYLVFDGYSSLRDGGPDGGELEIVLLEVKHGTSALSPSQRSIARSVEKGRVRFEICRVQEDGTVSTEAWRPRRST